MGGCAVSRRHINVCNRDMFSVVNMYPDHLSSVLCIPMIEGRSVTVMVSVSLMSVMSSALRDPPARTVVKLCTLGVFALR